MDKDTLLNLLRSLLKVAGSAAVAGGYMGDSDATAIVGGIVAIVGVVWSLVVHKKTAAALAAK